MSGDREVPATLASPDFRSLRLYCDCSGCNGQWLVDVGGVVDFVWGLILMRLMNPSAIVKVEVSGQTGLELPSVLVGAQVNVLVLHAAPFCAAPQNGAYVPRVVTWPAVPDAVDLPSMLGG
jgi:hypothetical protein